LAGTINRQAEAPAPAAHLRRPPLELVLSEVMKVLKDEPLPRIGKQEAIRARLRSVSPMITQLERDIAKDDAELRASVKVIKPKEFPIIEHDVAEKAELQRQLVKLRSERENLAKQENGLDAPVFRRSAETILGSMGVEKGSFGLWQVDATPLAPVAKRIGQMIEQKRGEAPESTAGQKAKLRFVRGTVADCLREGIPVSKGRLTWDVRKQRKFRDQRIEAKEAIPETHTDPVTRETRVISIWHPNGEEIYLDQTGRNVVCVRSKYGILHFRTVDANYVSTDITTFKPAKGMPREEFVSWPKSREALEASLYATMEGLCADVEEVYRQIAAQEPIRVVARLY